MNRSRKRKKRKSGIFTGILLVLLILCAASAVSFLSGADDTAKDSSSGQQAETAEEQETSDSLQELRGIVKDATMNTLMVDGDDGQEYLFGTEDVEISTGETGLLIGNPVTILYRGTLDPDASMQNVELVSITVTDAAAEEEKPDESSTTAALSKAQELLSTMTLEEKVGQMFIARCPAADAVQKAADYQPGGYILFKQDFSDRTKDQVIETIQSYQDAVKVPLFIGVDEEGGTVNRVSTNPNLRSSPFQSPQELYAEGGLDRIRRDTEEKCELLHSLGINLNFAPVCDVSQDPNDFIYKRSFGQDAEQTSVYVQTVVETMVKESMGSVLKHFPGYGNNADTHTGVAYDSRSYETFLDSDFLPFQAGIDAGASMVLVSHNVVSCMDDQAPASLSPQVHTILREDLGFDGVILTDDLAMDGVREFGDDTEIAVRAVQAGNDLLCSTDFEVQIPAVINAVQNGDISEERIDEQV